MDSTVERTVRKLTSGWRYLPPVDVVSSHAALPVAADAGVVGLYYRGSVFVVDGGDEASAIRTLGHELTHHGTRTAMGRSAWASFMGAVLEGQRSGDPTLAALRRHVGDTYSGDDLSNIRQADEAIARLAELRIDPRTGEFLVERPNAARIGAALRHFARERLLLPIPATAREAEGVLLHVADRLRQGRPWWDSLGFVYSGRMTGKPMGPKVPARSLDESLRMYRAGGSGSGVGWADTLRIWAMGLGFLALLVFVAIEVFAATTSSLGIIAGVPTALFLLWFFLLRKD